MSAPPIQTNDDLPEHRVAVVVFATVRAIDARDAGSIAEIAVSRALCGDLIMERPRQDVVLRIPVRVAEVRELGCAVGDSYLRVNVASKAYRGEVDVRSPEVIDHG